MNIALVNQLALLCERMGIDVWEVIDAAATKPFGFMQFTPGPGVGGHCIPVDPYYLAWRAREFDFVDRFVELAGDINFAMPRHVVDLVAEALNERGRRSRAPGSAILGVAFKPNVRDARNSPAADVIAGLAGRGADVALPRPARADASATPTASRDGAAAGRHPRGSDVVVVVTAHRAIDWARVYATPVSSSTPSTARAVGRRPSGRSSGSAPAGRSGHERHDRHAHRRPGTRDDDDPGGPLARAAAEPVHPRP